MRAYARRFAAGDIDALAAIEVPVDRLPDVMPPTTASVTGFIVAFQPAELAKVLGVSETAAGTLLYRAMEKLRKACDART